MVSRRKRQASRVIAATGAVRCDILDSRGSPQATNGTVPCDDVVISHPATLAAGTAIRFMPEWRGCEPVIRSSTARTCAG